MYQSHKWHSSAKNRNNHSHRHYGHFNRGQNFRPSMIVKDVNLFIRKAEEIVTIEDIPVSKNFHDFKLCDTLKENIAQKGYTQPTPIQDRAIQPILEGRDIIGTANTGTGKTAAFLIPIINQILEDSQKRALIVVPTRELAVQINEEMQSFAKNTNVNSMIVIGGINIKRQIIDLRKKPNILIATPGRLRDLVQRKIVFLDDFSIFVLDEVDLMVDIGFISDIKYFISLLPQPRQSLFFSATIPPKVNEIITSFVQNPVSISVKKQDTAQNVDQDIIRVINKEKKIDQLHDLLIQDEFEKVLIFGRTKHGIEKLNKQLNLRGFKIGVIHGNKSQNHRQRILTSFKQNEIKILLATDVASRGLDIDNVTHVINYDLPETYDDYIHRIGRTGRANKKGKALTFIE